MYIDTHAHIQDEQLIGEVEEVIKRADDNNVKKIICSSWNIPSSQKAVELSCKYEGVYATVGIHPENCDEYDQNSEVELSLLAKNNKVVAIGEIGLDYHYTKENKDLQKKIFVSQIILADKLGLPIVIHTRDAIGDTIQIIRDNKQYLRHGGVFHCFNASKPVLDEIIKLGFYVSYGGATTFTNARELKDLVAYTPIERILTETDCPYLTPVPYRGTRNEPKNIDLIIKNIASIKNMDLQEVENIIQNNTKVIYKI